MSQDPFLGKLLDYLSGKGGVVVLYTKSAPTMPRRFIDHTLLTTSAYTPDSRLSRSKFFIKEPERAKRVAGVTQIQPHFNVLMLT